MGIAEVLAVCAVLVLLLIIVGVVLHRITFDSAIKYVFVLVIVAVAIWAVSRLLS